MLNDDSPWTAKRTLRYVPSLMTLNSSQGSNKRAENVDQSFFSQPCPGRDGYSGLDDDSGVEMFANDMAFSSQRSILSQNSQFSINPTQLPKPLTTSQNSTHSSVETVAAYNVFENAYAALEKKSQMPRFAYDGEHTMHVNKKSGEPANYQFAGGVLLPPTPHQASFSLNDTSGGAPESPSLISVELVSASSKPSIARLLDGCSSSSTAQVKKEKNPADSEHKMRKKSSILKLDQEVRYLLDTKKILPGVKILRYKDSDDRLHRASLLPFGRVQADMKGGPVFARLEFWIRFVCNFDKGTLKAVLSNEMLRVRYENMPMHRVLQEHLKVKKAATPKAIPVPLEAPKESKISVKKMAMEKLVKKMRKESPEASKKGNSQK